MEDTAYRETEQSAIEEEKKERLWQERWGLKLPELISKMNGFIQEGTLESTEKLSLLLQDEKGLEPYTGNDVVTGMYMTMQLYHRELEQGMHPTILDQGNTVEEILAYQDSLRFILYRVDFEIDPESEEELITFLKEHKTSTPTLDFMMFSAVIRKECMVLRLEALFEKYGLFSYRLAILNYGAQTYPKNQQIQRKLSELQNTAEKGMAK